VTRLPESQKSKENREAVNYIADLRNARDGGHGSRRLSRWVVYVLLTTAPHTANPWMWTIDLILMLWSHSQPPGSSRD